MSADMVEGALARLTADTPAGWSDPARKGLTFVVEDYVSAEEAEDGPAFYWGSAGDGFNNIAVPASICEQVKSAADMQARKPPALAEVTRAVASEIVVGGAADFGINEVDYSDAAQGIVQVYGETADGLPFGFVVTISDIRQVDS